MREVATRMRERHAELCNLLGEEETLIDLRLSRARRFTAAIHDRWEAVPAGGVAVPVAVVSMAVFVAVVVAFSQPNSDGFSQESVETSAYDANEVSNAAKSEWQSIETGTPDWARESASREIGNVLTNGDVSEDFRAGMRSIKEAGAGIPMSVKRDAARETLIEQGWSPSEADKSVDAIAKMGVL